MNIINSGRVQKENEKNAHFQLLSEVENSFLPWRPQQFPQALAHFQLPVNLHSHLNINFKLSNDTSLARTAPTPLTSSLPLFSSWLRNLALKQATNKLMVLQLNRILRFFSLNPSPTTVS